MDGSSFVLFVFGTKLPREVPSSQSLIDSSAGLLVLSSLGLLVLPSSLLVDVEVPSSAWDLPRGILGLLQVELSTALRHLDLGSSPKV
ncbi:hypothetical protein BC827DRAFT_1271433 [Russula dissimulans]|nr:hypothetical protein BC827DRAFT_1271433 [Russula dissimulans]